MILKQWYRALYDARLSIDTKHYTIFRMNYTIFRMGRGLPSYIPRREEAVSFTDLILFLN